MPHGAQRIDTGGRIQRRNCRGAAAATIFSLVSLGNGGFFSRLGGWGGERGRRKPLDGQAAVGDQLTTDEGDLLSVSDEGEWWLGCTAAKCATRKRRFTAEGRGV